MKNIFKNIDKKLFFSTIILFVFGLIMIFSASNVKAFMFGNDPSIYFTRQLLFLVVTFIFCLVLIKIPSGKYKRLSWLALLAIIGALLVALIYSTAINETSGWLGIGNFGVQPSEFAKIISIVWLATYYGNMKKEDIDDKFKVFFPLFIVGIIAVIIMLQNDYGTAAIYLAISLFIFILAPISKKMKSYVVITGAILVATIGLLIASGKVSMLSSDKLARFNFIDPCSRFVNEGNQVCNSYIAINNGGIFGKGLGNSTQKYLYLPEAHTDFIYAIIVEELGLIGGILLIIFYIFVITRIVLIGKRSKRDDHALICYGVAVYLFLHIVVNLGGIMGLIPITGIPLSFVSYGGSFAVSTLIALTFVQRINYETNVKKS